MAKNEEEMSSVEEHRRKENIERRFSLYSLLRGIMIPGIIITGMCCLLPSLLRGFYVCEEGQNNNSGRAELSWLADWMVRIVWCGGGADDDDDDAGRCYHCTCTLRNKCGKLG